MTTAWLARYATGYHPWRTAQSNGRTVFYRPLGMVENSFDADGVYNEGRADINMAIHCAMKTNLSPTELKKHIVTAWTCLRLRHALLCAAASPMQDFMDEDVREKGPRFFVVQPPRDAEDAWRSSEQLVTFLGDVSPSVDADELYFHAQNTRRTFDPSKTLARLLVLPLERDGVTGTYSLRFLLIEAHQISDGLTNSAWAEDLLQLLNTRPNSLRESIPSLISTFQKRLPIPQEDLYQPISGSLARQRWFWAITLVLRHVQKPMPAAFSNPLRYKQPIPPSVPEEHLFASALDYSMPPTLNAGTVLAHVDRTGTQRLHRLCRQAGCSIGAGSFVLVAIAMMEIHEQRFPEEKEAQRQPFIGSFPVNPRPFFNHTATPDGVMLAFSDGVVLPFLSSKLDLDGRIKLLARSAQRQLSRYQKRRPLEESTTTKGMLRYMGPRGAGRVVPMSYLDVMERMNGKLPEHLRVELAYQNHVPRQANPTIATCGVSSVGRSNPALEPGRYDVNRALVEDDIVVDVRNTRQNVRPRDGEFLAGVWGSDDSISVNASYDACAIDPQWAQVFKKRIETMLTDSVGISKL